VQVRTLVDETDIGKIQPGMRAEITVDAYPNRPFAGTVLKIEPQSTTSQNVTMFPVLIRIGNEQGLLRPGMGASVAIQVAQRSNVLAIPNAALRTQRDVGSAAQVLGLDPDGVQATLARADSIAGTQRPAPDAAQTSSLGGTTGERRTRAPQQVAAAPATPAPTPAPAAIPAGPQGGPGMPPGGTGGPGGSGGPPPLPEGVTAEQWATIRQKRQNQEPLTPEESTIAVRVRENFQRLREQGGGQGGMGSGTAGAAPAPAAAPAGTTVAGGPPAGGDGMSSMLPPGVTEERARSIMQRGFTGGQLSAEERQIFNQIRARFAQAAGGSGGSTQRRRFGSGNNFQFGGSYIVFALRDGRPTPVRIRTGVTDMDYSEVVSGLTAQDTVLLLPSASLVQSQQEMRDRLARMGGGGVPGMRQQSPTATSPRAGTGTPAR
jgi:hypothetical protein